MSFCAQMKNELSEVKLKDCCKTALIYGFALFGRSFNAKRICVQTDNEKVAKLYARLLSGIFGVDVSITRGGGKRPTFVAEVKNDADRLKILASVDFGIYDGRINSDVFENECCIRSFVRGVFLSCGHLSDPDKCYRLDFNTKDESSTKEFVYLLNYYDIDAHIAKRGNGYCAYIKKNEMIANFLAFIGAGSVSLQYIEASVMKSFNNKTNRASNCDNANINRTVEASLKQRNAIKYLSDHGRLDTLPNELYAAAKLRSENPELSLKQLVKISSEPITVSGLNHRFKKIIEIYEELKSGR